MLIAINIGPTKVNSIKKYKTEIKYFIPCGYLEFLCNLVKNKLIISSNSIEYFFEPADGK